jgi:hypothetical protein
LLLWLRTWSRSGLYGTRLATHLLLRLLLSGCANAFALRLLSHWSCWTFSLRRLLSLLLLLNTSLLASRISLLPSINCWLRLLLLSRLLNPNRLLRRFLSSSSSLALTLVTHLELLTLRAVRNCLDAHRLGDVTPEPRFDWRNARNHRSVVELAGDSRRNVDLSTTPR